ncbi:hypothetical protein FKM82_007613 [Ascaphus truei]
MECRISGCPCDLGAVASTPELRFVFFYPGTILWKINESEETRILSDLCPWILTSSLPGSSAPQAFSISKAVKSYRRLKKRLLPIEFNPNLFIFPNYLFIYPFLYTNHLSFPSRSSLHPRLL